ncbi:lipid A core-O-antigen ligase-like enyme [Beggiatoa alba B18LD]|uniref:Lipid A core-O-antigen ligase-like enyme n=1 Tax=Beggiatoa alba B18LD TaxID=395493 RepID=I3CCS4_9GAMM|nr:O-antigen ligase family protein [Beggiatoa alba]EIJ41417.1 lipid A core-O-antigen ligase-like enyme [Beggiatoa alba B18LD]
MSTPPLADRYLFISLLLLIIWLPIPFASNHAWAWAIMEISIFSLWFIWIISFLQQKISFPATFYRAYPLLILWSVWLLYLILQCLPLPYYWVNTLSPSTARLYQLATFGTTPTTLTLSVDVFSTQAALLKSISYVLLFALVLVLVNRHSRLRWVAYCLLISGVVQAVYGSVMTLTGWEYGFLRPKTAYEGFATGTFVNRNHFANYLILSFSMGLGLLISQLRDTQYETWRQRLRAWLTFLFSHKMRLRLYLIILVIALILTRSRMGNIAFFGSLLITGFIGLFFARHTARSVSLLLFSLILIDLAVMGTFFGIEQLSQRINVTHITGEERGDVYLYAFHYWKDFFWMGSGLGSFYAVFPSYWQSGLGGYYDHAHNDYLEFATETGLIGLSILACIVLASLLATFLTLFRRRDPLCRGIALGVMMGILAMLIHSMVDFSLQIPANAATFIIFLALAWVSYLMPRHVSRTR